MTISDASAWFAEQLAGLPAGSQTAAAYSLAIEALGKWEEFLDVEADYAAAAKKSAEACRPSMRPYDRRSLTQS